MVAPPSEEGAVKLTVAAPSPAVIDVMVGAEDATALTTSCTSDP